MSDNTFQLAIANAPVSLIDAQKEYRKWFELLSTARDEFARAEIAYELEFASYIRDNTATAAEAKTITVLRETGKSHCAKSFSEKVLAECQVEKCRDAIAFQVERIQTAKALMRLDFGKAT